MQGYLHPKLLRRMKTEKVSDHSYWEKAILRTTRRGHFWVTGERLTKDGLTYQAPPMFVQWESPETITKPHPVILVHGGRMQGTEWLDTPDGRPGWAQRLLEDGYVVLVVDRPGHGRSPVQPDITGPTGTPFSYEEGRDVYFNPNDAALQTQWPLDLKDQDALDQFIAPFGPLPTDLAGSQKMDADRLARLLDKIGPAILFTHSASGPAGWFAADLRPGLVVAIVSVEPMGPPFADIPLIGTLDWGLTSVPLSFDPPLIDPETLRSASPSTWKVPSLTDLPIAVLTGEAAVFATYGPAIVEFLNTCGASADLLHLPDHGVFGNGHGLIYELNSDAALKPVLKWLDNRFGDSTINSNDTDHQVQAGQEASTLADDRQTVYVTYAGHPDDWFDRQYYDAVHLPLVMEAWQKYGLISVKSFYPPSGESGTIAICECVFQNEAAINAAFTSPEVPAVMADVQRYTNLAPSRSQAVAL